MASFQEASYLGASYLEASFRVLEASFQEASYLVASYQEEEPCQAYLGDEACHLEEEESYRDEEPFGQPLKKRTNRNIIKN